MYDQLEIDQHIETFEGYDVVNYDRETGLRDPATTAPRFQTLWIDDEQPAAPLSTTRKIAMVAIVGLTALGAALWSAWAVLFGLFAILSLLPAGPQRQIVADADGVWAAFAAESELSKIRALVIGPWFSEIDEDADDLVRRLVALAEKLPNLRALFINDVVSYECEISWLPMTDLTPVLDAYPELETLVVRGADGLRFEGLRHARLRKLVVQSGGMSPDVIADLSDANLPSLEHLELWLGDRNYGFASSIDQLRPLWQPGRFEALQTLALRNCELADDVARELSMQPAAVSRLDRLDLSLGTLTDIGAEALYNNPGIEQLDELDLHYHYLSPDWAQRLQSLPITVDISCPCGPADPEADPLEDDRYVAVGE